MKTLNYILKNTDKCILFIYLFCGIIFMVSCTDNYLSDNQTKVQSNKEIDKDQLKKQFGYAIARILAEDKDVREIIKSEALKKIDFDYDVLYEMIKKQKNKSGCTIEELLLKYIQKDSLSLIIKTMPTLTIFVPKLPENVFSAEQWNISNTIPKVGIRLSCSNEVPILDKFGNEKIIHGNEIPAYPVVVIKENERLTVNKESHTKLVSKSLVHSETADINFISSVFDNRSETKESKVESPTQTRARPAIVTKMDPRFQKLKEAYKKYPNTSGWQRDYIYYNISPTSPNGPFSYLYKEFIWGFEMIGDGRAAINKIADQSGDPRIDGRWHQGPVSDRGTYTDTGWTDGEFEFKVKIYLASKTAVGNELITYFRAMPENLFFVHHTKNEDKFEITSVENMRMIFKQNPIPLFSWNLEEYGNAIKIEVEEVDTKEEITQKITSQSEFATNFEYSSQFGETIKSGAKFGASSKTVRTVEYTVTKSLGNDELGQTIVNFGDIVVPDTTLMINEMSQGKRPPSTAILNLSSQYSTGWYRIFIAPGPIQQM